MTSNNAVSKVISAQLASKGQSKMALADYLGFTREALGRRLSDKMNWNLDELDKVASFLGYGNAIDLMELSKILTDAEQRLASTDVNQHQPVQELTA